jgi:flagellar basal-body rod modification protein FlgD
VIAPIANTAAPQSGSGSQTSGGSAGTVMATQNMFLQLLVAQLKNQDPSNPMDGSTFVTQLAQMQQLEQSVNSGQDLAAIRKDLDQLVGNPSAPTSQS